ncbi:MAG: hypothetical protein NWS20_02440 [Rickettsiaceae bacterium]|nr:hypothetical protein [Rickettsiaceae bacterium]MDP4832563.1 hypothetical protein [Rickettsiaceae bacterium]MDP5020195.1 hypothetical protein [Rickettsiaceae bacterium]MDP5082909.1 hypothetical protein [Rickettsiaceae bacterium]
MKLDWSNQQLTRDKLAKKLKDLRQEEWLEFKELNLESNKLESIDGIEFPDGLEKLLLFQNSLPSVDNVMFPGSLKELDLGCNRLTSIDKAKFPEGLEALYLYANNLTSLDNAIFPAGLQILSIASNYLTSVINIKLPKGLKEFIAGGLPIASSEKELYEKYMLEMAVCNNDNSSLQDSLSQEEIIEDMYAPFNDGSNLDLS